VATPSDAAFFEEHRYEAAQRLALLLKATPEERHGEQLGAMLAFAELARTAIAAAEKAVRNRRRAGCGAAPDGMVRLLLDIATRVTLGHEDEPVGRGRRTDNARFESLSEQQLKNVTRAIRAGLDAADEMIATPPGDELENFAQAVLFGAEACTALEAYQLEHGRCSEVVAFGLLAGILGTGKQKPAPQVAVLALAMCGYKNSAIARMLDRDPAEVRRLVKPARVS
jgi:hypothetical protein